MIRLILLCSIMLVKTDSFVDREKINQHHHHHHHLVSNYTGKGLREVPRGVFRKTESLILSNNRIKDLRYQFRHLNQLIHLNISNNSLSVLNRDDIFVNLIHLKELDLSNNRFKTLYSSVFRGLKRLESLYINNCGLKYIDEHSLFDLGNLKILHLSNNQIDQLFLEFFQYTPNLQELNVNGNSLNHLNGGLFASLTGLIRLYMSNNQLITINENAFVGLDSLQELYLRDNYIEHIPSIALQSLKRIHLLDIGGNLFTSIETGDFVHTSVNTIWIDNCLNLDHVERRSFWDLPNLTIIYLNSGGSLKYIDNQAFLGTPNLRTIYLHNNSLLTFEKNILSHILHRKKASSLNVTLNFNPFKCDCNIHFIYQCIHSSNCRLNILDKNELNCWSENDNTTYRLSNLSSEKIPSQCSPILIDDSLESSNFTIRKKIGDRITLPCRALAIPNPTIKWILPNGVHFNSSMNNVHIQLKEHGSLKLLHLRSKDSGYYTCVVSNLHGSITKTVQLIVDNPSIQIWPLGISSSFVSIVWNGTTFRNAVPEYQILYKPEDDQTDRYESISIVSFLKSYTITGLQPGRKYKLCIAVKDAELDQGFIQLSCTLVETHAIDSFADSFNHTSNLAFKLSILLTMVTLIVVIVSGFLSRKSRRQQRLYETPQKTLINHMVSIPMSRLPRTNEF